MEVVTLLMRLTIGTMSLLHWKVVIRDKNGFVLQIHECVANNEVDAIQSAKMVYPKWVNEKFKATRTGK